MPVNASTAAGYRVLALSARKCGTISASGQGTRRAQSIIDVADLEQLRYAMELALVPDARVTAAVVLDVVLVCDDRRDLHVGAGVEKNVPSVTCSRLQFLEPVQEDSSTPDCIETKTYPQRLRVNSSLNSRSLFRASSSYAWAFARAGRSRLK